MAREGSQSVTSSYHRATHVSNLNLCAQAWRNPDSLLQMVTRSFSGGAILALAIMWVWQLPVSWDSSTGMVLCEELSCSLQVVASLLKRAEPCQPMQSLLSSFCFTQQTNLYACVMHVCFYIGVSVQPVHGSPWECWIQWITMCSPH